MSLKQTDDLQVQGNYWYAQGTINGMCEIDDQAERVILRYGWGQRRDGGDSVGTGGSGRGVMAIQAGYDFLYGYWCPGDDQANSQGWSAARLTADLTDDIRRGGPYAKDFGLQQHPLKSLIDW
jgi:hypothetical protein